MAADQDPIANNVFLREILKRFEKELARSNILTREALELVRDVRDDRAMVTEQLCVMREIRDELRGIRELVTGVTPNGSTTPHPPVSSTQGDPT
jgi:hypothetical protein